MYYPMMYGNGYNPMPIQPQRTPEFEQSYQQYQPQSQQVKPPIQQGFIKCRAVTSIEEARASMIDLDGSINVFVDAGNKQIYTKQINLDGTATLNTYKLVENTTPISSLEPEIYVKQEELESVCRNFTAQISELQKQLKGYEKASSTLREERKSGGARK